MKKYLPLLSFLFFIACTKKDMHKTSDEALKYPVTYKDENVADNYHGTKVPDPYRWLEDDHADNTKAWVKAQNEVTFSYLDKIPYRQKLRDRLERIYNYEKYSAPFREGDNYFYYKNDGLQDQAVLYKTSGLDEEGEVFMDPNKMSEEGIVSLGAASVNKDGTLFGYTLSEAGSDWRTIYVRRIKDGVDLEDKIEWAKFTGIAWHGDGFYYGAYKAPDDEGELSDANKGMKLYYHKLGTPQSSDKVIFEDTDNPNRYFGAGTTDDERFLQVTSGQGTSGNDLRIKDLTKPGSDYVVVKSNMDTDAYMIGNDEEKIYIMTNDGAPNQRLVKVTLEDPENWQEVIPEDKNHVLESVTMAGGKLFARYMKDVKNLVYQYDLNGNLEREIELPGLGTINGFGGKKEDTDLFYTFTSFTAPATIYRYNIASGKSEIFRKSKLDFNEDDYVTKQVFYPSKDGTKIPMYIVHKKGIKLDGTNPTYLYGYGGFNISIKPGFSITRQVWLENGGIYAQANLRGGGEYGKKWHDAGRLLNKQNVFDDFIAAGEYLIDEGYTSKEKLAISGRSNGGLLVGAVMTQRPDLFKVALPGVGVMDMLRYEQFTIGYAWATDFGSVKDEKHFKNLLSYSPLHNLKDGVEYPATMVTTADHDDRVVPAHSFKFAATLQEKHKGKNPVLIRVDVDAGHGSGKPTSKILDEWADIYSFTMFNVGMQPKYLISN